MRPGLFQTSMRTTVSGHHNSGAGNGKGCNPGLAGTVSVSHCGNTVPGCCWEGWVADELICQMRSWPPDILKCSIICGTLRFPSSDAKIWVVLFYFGVFHSSNVLRKTKYIFLDYKAIHIHCTEIERMQKNTQNKILPPRDPDFFKNVLWFPFWCPCIVENIILWWVVGFFFLMKTVWLPQSTL